MRDANKVAKEIAMSKRPESEEEGLRLTDHRYGRVAMLAIQRIRHLFETKDHYLHQAKESGKKNRQEAKARKDQSTNGYRSLVGSNASGATNASQSISQLPLCSKSMRKIAQDRPRWNSQVEPRQQPRPRQS